MNFTKASYSNTHLKFGLFYFIIACLLVSSCIDDKSENQTEIKDENKVEDIELNSKVEEEILSLENAWASALVADDLNFVASIMHNDFRLIRAYGDAPPISKDMYLGMKGMSVLSADVTSVKVSTEMDSIVVARTTWTMNWEQDGVGKLPPHFDVIDTWKKNKNGEWQILSRVSQTVDKPYTEN
jgi:ketosteroid isomerase-like protein